MMTFALPGRCRLFSTIAAAVLCLPAIATPQARAQADAASQAPTTQPATYDVLQQRSDRMIAELPNRMIVIAQSLPAAPVASVQVWIKTGSIYEQEHVGAGLSHFLEHLISGGTTSTRTEEQSNAILGSIGAQTNAATSLDNVHYYINTTSDHASTAIDLLSDWMQNSKITQAEYERERDVIQREFSMGQGEPGRIFWKLTQQARYAVHPARHPTIGYLDEFLSISRDEIYDFYRRMYVPNNMVFVVAGDIDPQAVVDQLVQLWADVPTGELPELSFPVEPEIDSPRSLAGNADIDQPRLRLAWPGTRLGGEHDYALDLLAMILGQGESSRLTRSIRDQQRLSTSVMAYNLSFPWGKGFFAIDADVSNHVANADANDTNTQAQQTATLTDALLKHVQQLRDTPVSEAELARAKRNVLADVISANQTAQGVASRLARDVIGMGDPDYLTKYAQAIQSLTPADLQLAAQQLLTPDRLITIKLLPLTDDAGPQDLTRTDDLADADSLPRKPIDLDNRVVLGELTKAVANADDAGRAITVDPVQQYTLNNGLRLLVQRSTLVPAVSMQLFWKGGLLAEPADKHGIANAMATMLMRGSTSRTAQQIAEAAENLGASLNTASGSNTTYAQASALKEDWPAVLELMADVLLHPSFPSDQWQSMQPRLLAAIERQRDSWYGELTANFRKTFYPNHPWAYTPLGDADVIAGLTVDDLRTYHQGQLAGENAVIAVVGDIAPEAVLAAVKQHFGHLPRTTDGSFVPPTPAATTATIEQVLTRKPVAAVTIGFGPVVSRSHPDYPSLLVLSRLMSNFPTGWLDRALRGQGKGLVYADWATVVTGLVPGDFEITFNTKPDTAAEALAAAMNVVSRAKHQPISEDELARAKAKVLTGEFFSRQSNSDRAMQLALDELYGVGDPTGDHFMQQVQALTPDNIHTTARKYLHNPVIVLLTNEQLPEAELNQAVEGAASTQPAE